jgi:hypothetical protein
MLFLLQARTRSSKVAEMENDLVEYLDKHIGGESTFWEQEACVWAASHDRILDWDMLEHYNLARC